MNSEKEITLHLDYPQNLILAVVQNDISYACADIICVLFRRYKIAVLNHGKN